MIRKLSTAGRLRAGAALLLALFAAAPAVTPQQAVRKLEAAFAALRSLQAEFEQEHASAVIATPLRETGKFYFQKPDRMRWEYDEPEAQTFVFKEGRVWNHLPEDGQLLRYALPEEQQNSLVFALLTGRARLEDDYLVEPAEFPTDLKSTAQVKLVPKTAGDFSHILLELDARTWLIVRIVTLDTAGGRQEFVFRRLKVNPRLNPSTFEIKVPEGTEIIDDAPTSEKAGSIAQVSPEKFDRGGWGWRPEDPRPFPLPFSSPPSRGGDKGEGASYNDGTGSRGPGG